MRTVSRCNWCGRLFERPGSKIRDFCDNECRALDREQRRKDTPRQENIAKKQIDKGEKLPKVDNRSVRCAEHQIIETLSTSTIGALSEIVASAYMMRHGIAVFRALSPSCMCDLVVVHKNKMFLVEVRTAYINGSSKKIYFPIKESDKNNSDVICFVVKTTMPCFIKTSEFFSNRPIIYESDIDKYGLSAFE